MTAPPLHSYGPLTEYPDPARIFEGWRTVLGTSGVFMDLSPKMKTLALYLLERIRSVREMEDASDLPILVDLTLRILSMLVTPDLFDVRPAMMPTGITPDGKTYTVSTTKLRAMYQKKPLQELAAIHGIRAVDEFLSNLANLSAMEIDRMVIQAAMNQAINAPSRVSLTVLTGFLFNTSGLSPKFVIVSTEIFQELRSLGVLTNIVPIGNAATFSQRATAAPNRPTPITVYEDPYFPKKRIFVGESATEALTWYPYVLINSTPPFMSKGDGSPRKGFTHRSATVVHNSQAFQLYDVE